MLCNLGLSHIVNTHIDTQQDICDIDSGGPYRRQLRNVRGMCVTLNESEIAGNGVKSMKLLRS
jgi:hypothetical protein